MLEHVDLETPFSGEQERGVALASLLGACVELERWRSTARQSAEIGVSERGALVRWSTLFAEELDAVLDSRNRVVHGIRLSDRELRGADWLARQLLRQIEASHAA